MEMMSVQDNSSFNGAATATDRLHLQVAGQLSDNQSSSSTASSTNPSPAASSPLFASSPESILSRPVDDHHLQAGTASSAANSTIVNVTVVPAAALDPLTHHNTWTRAQVMKSLKESIPHKIRLQQLHKSERQHQKDGTWHKKGVRRLSKDLYVILGCYAVLQSAIFAAVAQTNIFTCEDWWGAPAGIAGMVTLGALLGVLDKLRRIGQEQEQVLRFQARQNAVWDKINILYLRGSACNLDTLEPQHNRRFDADPGLLCVFSPYGLLVLGLLACFSTLIIVSCLSVLCGPCKCQ